MRTLHKKEWIAVAASVGLLAYIFFSAPLMRFFTSSMTTQDNAQTQQGVAIKDISVGTGAVAAAGDVITTHYVGRLTDGRVFDSSRDRGTPISFLLGSGQVIKGWDEGINGMRVGGTRVLTISPEFGYGAQAVGPIPPNSTLIFEVELLDVKKGQ
jgi:FKBP-type peptidyl-prolyl cis-trans isomerase